MPTANLVRAAFLNRLIALLRSSDKLLDSLGLPKEVNPFRRDGTEDMPNHTSPMRVIEGTLSNPFFYLRAACEEKYGCGLNLLELPEQLHGLCCYPSDEQVPGTQAHDERRRREKENIDRP